MREGTYVNGLQYLSNFWLGQPRRDLTLAIYKTVP